jgi:RNA polymerase sigma-54 factor
MTYMQISHEAKQSQVLSPRLQHAVRLLQMSSLDFAATVTQMLGKNPFLEMEEDEAPVQDTDEASGEPDALSEPSTEFTSDDHDHDHDRDLWLADTGSGSSGSAGDDSEASALDLMPVETSLAAHLHAQLGVTPLAPRELLLARWIVDSLDDDGYLRTPLSELVNLEALTPLVALPELEAALQGVQCLEPLGVAARSVGECLQLQLPAIECPRERALAHTIVTQHLEKLATRDMVGLAKQMGQPLQRVSQVCERLRRLDPRPGWRFSPARVDYVVPDVVVKKIRGQWSVQLNPAIVPRVRLNQVYADMFARHRTAQNTEMAGHLQEARWAVKNAALRFSTILEVAQAIVDRQRHFLEFGDMAMKPLGLREIADEVGVHESTVSRVTNNKYMATPSGVFELKHFFSRSMVSANGSACSGTAIRGLIKDMIEAEPAKAPRSDAEITRQLSVQGLVVARRTVTKYRQMLQIDPVDRRRRCA